MKKIILLIFSFIFLTGCTSNYKEISVKEAYEMIENDNKIVIIDVREIDEYKSGHLKNAILIPLSSIENEIKDKVPNKETKIIVYCYSGKRAKDASGKLINMGYKKVYTFGGIKDWKYEVVK